MRNSSHPSYLELDRVHLGAGSEETRDHVAACSECAAYFSRLNLPVAIPKTLAHLENKRLTLLSKRWPLLVAAVSCSVLIGLVAPTIIKSTHETEMVRAKAAQPAVAIHVKRGERVALWDGQSPVHPGDRLRIEVAAEGYRHVRVTTGTELGGTTVLYEGVLPAERSWLLPLSFEVNEKGSTEILDIVLSEGRVSGKSWSTHLVLIKTPSVGGQQ